MIINFLLSLFGFLIFKRTFSKFVIEFGISKYLFNIIVGCLLLQIVLVSFLSQHTFLLWILIGIIWISLNNFHHFFQFFLLQSLKKQLIPLLDQIILGLQVGMSFRTAFLSAVESQQTWIRHQLLEIYNAMIISSERKSMKSKFLDELLKEFSEIDASKTKIIDQVRAFRRQIKFQEDFRRKSGQISMQIKIQAIIVTFLYLSLLIFVVIQFGFIKNLQLILSSLLLFLIGLAWIFLIGRRIKWKI